MAATVILGLLVAIAFLFGLRRMYRIFAKGDNCCGGCSTCSAGGNKVNYGQWLDKVNKFDMKRSIDVDGMTCEHCVHAVKNALEGVDGVVVAAVSLEKRSARVGLEHDVPDDALKAAVKKAGYKPGACEPV